jgi:hypothetical protein
MNPLGYLAVWSDEEVARRWLRLCPARKTAAGEPEEPSDAEIAALTGVPQRLAELRRRLSDISWFMRMTAEPLARRANREEQTSGRFWQGRFKSTKLCDDAAILSGNVYVDLNVIRAGLADTPEESDFTSAQRRIQALAIAASTMADEPSRARQAGTSAITDDAPDAWLAPLPLDESAAEPGPAPSACPARCSDRGFLPLPVEHYLELLDWTGRQLAAGKRGAIPTHLAPILERLQIAEGGWLNVVGNFGRLFYRVAGGPSSVSRQRTRLGRRFRPGGARLLGAAAAPS